MLDLRLSGLPQSDAATQRELLATALGDRYVQTCTSSLTTEQAACAIAARDMQQASACHPQAAD